MTYDVVILGAGAAGLFAAGLLRGRRVLVVDHARAPGEKIRISGGGRCNFTNLGTGPGNFLSGNPHFAKSALARYTPADFVGLVRRHGIAFHEKTLGQLFCDGSARQIVRMLLDEMAGAELRLGTSVTAIDHGAGGFRLGLSDGSEASAPCLLVATGGKSIPGMGASGFGYEIARRFGLAVTEIRPALVPLTFGEQDLAWMRPLAGISLPVIARAGDGRFDEAALFTHRGLSGPAILQVSSYWREGEEISLDLLRDAGAAEAFRAAKKAGGRRQAAALLAERFPARLAQALSEREGLAGPLAELPDARLRALAGHLADFRLKPVGSEGYRTAEVTLGGVDTGGLDARTLQARAVPGLYFVGEVVDVTGWLGGYNFQWAWASAHAAASAIAAGQGPAARPVTFA